MDFFFFFFFCSEVALDTKSFGLYFPTVSTPFEVCGDLHFLRLFFLCIFLVCCFFLFFAV